MQSPENNNIRKLAGQMADSLLPESNPEWWHRSSRKKVVDAYILLLEKDLPIDDIHHIISLIWNAAREEYGE